MPPPLGLVKEKVTVLVVLVGRHCAVGVALRRAVDDEVPSAVWCIGLYWENDSRLEGGAVRLGSSSDTEPEGNRSFSSK